MLFTKQFLGVPDGEIYPVQYQPGDECPPELKASAIAIEAVDVPAGQAGPTAAGRAKK